MFFSMSLDGGPANNMSEKVITRLEKAERRFSSAKLWFATANNEPFVIGRVRDVTDFRILRPETVALEAVSNRAPCHPATFGAAPTRATSKKPRQDGEIVLLLPLAPNSNGPRWRRLLAEIELRVTRGANAIFCSSRMRLPRQRSRSTRTARSSPERAHGHADPIEGSKQRSVPLPLTACRAIQAYSQHGGGRFRLRTCSLAERGPLTDRGVRVRRESIGYHRGSKHLLRYNYGD